VKLVQTRANAFTLTATSQELSALMAAARLTYDSMTADPSAPREAMDLLGRILRDFDAALARTRRGDPPASAETG
jgi:hypothetical protein